MTDSLLHTDRPSANLLQFGAPAAMPQRAADDEARRSALLAPILETMPDEVFEHLRAYAPRTIPESMRIAVGAFIRDAAAAVAPRNVFTAEQTTAPIARLVSWAHVSNGLPLRYVVHFAPAVIDRFLADGVAKEGLAPGTARNYRAHLARVAEAMGIQVEGSPAPIRRTERVEPYTDAELTQWRLWARTRPTPMSKARADVMLALMAGAGLRTDEALAVEAQHVIVDADDVWIRVTGDRPRVVPLLPLWRNRLLKRVQGLPVNTFVFPPGMRPTTLNRWLRSMPSAPAPQRLRATWLVCHLAANTGAEHLLVWSGIECGETLAGYLPFLPGPVDENRRRELLNARRADALTTARPRPWEMPRIAVGEGTTHQLGRTAR